MSKEIDINNEEQILKECDFDYYYDSVCSRELCMFFNDIARQDSRFDKLQAYIDLGRIGITINKLFRVNTDLEAKLAEKDKEIEKLNAMIDTLPAHDKEFAEIHDQDKISFAVERLVNIQKYITDNAVFVEEECFGREINEFIDNQIEEIKKENERENNKI